MAALPAFLRLLSVRRAAEMAVRGRETALFS